MTFGQQEDDNVTFIDAENYQGEKEAPLTYEMIVLSHIRKCVLEGSKEMTGGYIHYKQVGNKSVEEYIPDQRKVYMQCIKSLYDILLPFFDEIMEKADKDFDSKLEAIADSIKKSLKTRADVASPNLKNQILLQLNTGYLDVNSPEFKSSIDEKIEIYRWLYQQLVLLFVRNKYLMKQDIED